MIWRFIFEKIKFELEIINTEKLRKWILLIEEINWKIIIKFIIIILYILFIIYIIYILYNIIFIIYIILYIIYNIYILYIIFIIIILFYDSNKYSVILSFKLS